MTTTEARTEAGAELSWQDDVDSIRASLAAEQGRPALRTAAVWPFVACGVLGFGTLLLPPHVSSSSELILIGVLVLVAVGMAVAFPWERLPRWSHSVMPLAFFVIIALMRDVSGGAASGLTPMVAIPVLWLILFGDRWALHLAAVATAVVFVLPILAAGAPLYPPSDWRLGVLWMAVIWLIGPFAQRFVRRLEVRERQLSQLLVAVDDAHQEWRQLADELPDTVVLVVDEDMRYRRMSGAGAMRQGIADWEGRTLFETSSPENIRTLGRLYRGALDGARGTGVLMATRNKHQHEVLVVPYNEHGHRRALVVARDVSDAYRREQEIWQLNARIERLIEDAPIGICVADLDGAVTRMNPALRELLGAQTLTPTTTLDGLGLLRSTAHAVDSARRSPSRRYIEENHRRGSSHAPRELTVDVVLLEGEHAGELLVHVHDISERRRFEERLQHLAQHDPLTGLANRRKFDDAVDAHLRQCARYGSQGAVLMLDLDHFKEVNDSFGHDIGDQLILSVSRVLSKTLRDSDTVARLGGDEFAVLLPRGGRQEAERVAERIVEAVRSETAGFEPRTVRPLSASVGAVVINDAHTTSKELLVAADMTMYDAKDAGRDRYEVFDIQDHATPGTAARTNWAAQIRQALRDNRFVLHAQPIVELASGRTTGAELLLRMVGEDGELVPPGRFLGIAEKMGLAPQVDRWVVRQAIALQSGLDATSPRPHLSVNVSAHSLNDSAFVDAVAELVRSSAVDPTDLTFEVTETAAIGNMEHARAFAERLQGLGCSLALDDFGAGHASFYYLKHLPFDVIKIDGEFVRTCTTDTSDRLVIASVVAFSEGTSRRVIAEFVGDEQTRTALQEMGVHYGQGFHLGPPVPWPDFADQWAASQS